MESLSSQVPASGSGSGHSSGLEGLDMYSSYSESLPSPPGNVPRQGRLLKPKPNGSCRRKREFISDEKKDASYWEKRRKNNEAAKRSREKRRLNDMVLENRVMALNDENLRLKTELLQLKLRFGLISTSSYMEKSQQIASGGGLAGAGGGAASGHYFSSAYSSSSQVLMNSDSSEAEQSGLGEGHTLLAKYSPRGSLSDMSDGSSRDSPEPVGCEIKRENAAMDIGGLEVDIAGSPGGSAAHILFGIHSSRLPAHHQHTHSHHHHGEPVASPPAAPPVPQRSVILYRSSNTPYCTEKRSPSAPPPPPPAPHQQTFSATHSAQTHMDPPGAKNPETLVEGSEQLENTTLESLSYEFSERTEGHAYRHTRPLQEQDGATLIPDLHPSREETQAHLYHQHSYNGPHDEDPPVLTYEGGSRPEAYFQECPASTKDTSSSDGDPRSSDKDTSTDDESPSSSCSEAASYRQRPPAESQATSFLPPGTVPSNQSPEAQAEVRGTALPHKLRLKLRAMSGSGSQCDGASAPPLPQHPYLALAPSSHQATGKHAESWTPVASHKQTSSFLETEEGWKDCGKKETAGRPCRNKRRD
ncbi:uncharacterized protein [Paramormyrops kingsleyae]|uniref:Uncharacterized LOC111856311 n=1 Tax=Paramormyrops kingsleyae TaxID=1676925 RepID=A0A3B3RZX9_9TELE|nr:uncharacterized protein LOC111856311 [Paramormyrops kingsleyae]